MNRVTMCVVYASEDGLLVDELQAHLAFVDPLNLVSIAARLEVTDHSPEQSYLDQETLCRADIVALFITPRLITSGFTFGHELRCAVEKHSKSKPLILPLLMRAAVWQTGPLSDVNPLPKDGIPVLARRSSDLAMRQLATDLKAIAQNRVASLAVGTELPAEPAASVTIQDHVSEGEYCFIPPGTFKMGRNNVPPLWWQFLTLDIDSGEKPAHTVAITRGFWLSKCPVTQWQWERVMGNHPSRLVGAERPVEGITWDDAQEFVRRLNVKSPSRQYRLPTEAEWEYAARAGTTHPSYGLEPQDTAWFDRPDTQPVGRKQPNPWGLHDMLGNVWEWCNDWYDFGFTDPYYSISPASDPEGPSTGSFRVLRGSACYHKIGKIRVTVRNYSSPVGTELAFGMRCVMVAGSGS